METMTSVLPPIPEMERAYRRSDPSYDGIFFLGVRTTGIFCKPSCPARKPMPENVEYYSTPREAVFAGYRPCKRCHPLDLNGTPEWAERLLDAIDREPERRYTDADLKEMGIEPARARRYFLKNYGMTFQAYCRGRRLGKSLEQIRLGEDLDDVALGFGYESHSGFREAFVKTFGTPPGRSRETDCIVAAWIESPLGPLIAGATSEGICFLEFTDRRMLEAQVTTMRKHFKCAIVPGSNDYIRQLQKELGEYFAGKRKKFSLPLIYPGSRFQQDVWNELLKIPYGTTTSYEEIARRVGSAKAVRAVGTANGMNRIAIVIPCHRVVNKNGELGGYGGGLRRKEALLRLERGEMTFEFSTGNYSGRRPESVAVTGQQING
jgi:AraC family transcriptional regulator, regulatory protein of adaptative response / methylated-DNA-[protein]-cysteine methyltransferase